MVLFSVNSFWAANLLNAQTPERKPEWQLDTEFEYSSFSRQDKDSWQGISMQLGRHVSSSVLGEKAFVYGRVSHNNRQTSRDESIAVGVYKSIGKRMEGYVDVEHTPDADFKPEWRLRIGMEAPWFKMPFNTEARLTFNGQYDKEANTNSEDAKIAKLGMRWQLNETWQAHAEYIFVQDDIRMHGGKIQANWQTSSGKLKGFMGAANGPENESNVTVRTASGFTGVAYDMTPNVTVRTAIAREVRKQSYIRDVATLSLSFKF